LKQETNLLIIGAGPFGLAVASNSQHLGIDHLIVGKPMEFWKTNMPDGMFLRSASDWHLDPQDVDTIEHFLQTQDLTPADVEPLSRELYLKYVQWFQKQKHLEMIPKYVKQLDYIENEAGQFQATLEDGHIIIAKQIVMAIGFKYFKNTPKDLVERLPAGRFSHTCDHVEFKNLKDKRCLIIGGRQSAFEWTALINEAGAKAIHVVHRHDSPTFTEADWSWVNPIVDAMIDNPGWFRNLTKEEKDSNNHRLWAEGRLKVEPWLESRVTKETVKLWQNTQVISCDELPDGSLAVSLENGENLIVDHIILATGYKVNMSQVPFLKSGNILQKLKTLNGFPVLDKNFQTNIPGFFVTSMAAAQDFGPFFGFTISTRTSAKLIGQALVNGEE